MHEEGNKIHRAHFRLLKEITMGHHKDIKMYLYSSVHTIIASKTQNIYTLRVVLCILKIRYL